MSTRSLIARELPDNKIEYVYCHFDGYLDGVGRTLFNHYKDPDKVKTLISLGWLSSLGEEIGEKHDFETRPDNQCTYYARDRGEEKQEPRVVENSEIPYLRGRHGSCYVYLFRNNQWFVKIGDERLILLAEAFIQEKLNTGKD